ncbi:hypothetical protein BOX15_Mlig028778g1 [Macrostomum lignano]|uniref:Uncharacterized protein n=2 Tax=Macrostomum lignano TaxID=282301 RepID=A0A267GYA1_9PLAT|nr:hypothetical protein BOX15_Mlig028778g1 [Macrostomum lignano]
MTSAFYDTQLEQINFEIQECENEIQEVLAGLLEHAQAELPTARPSDSLLAVMESMTLQNSVERTACHDTNAQRVGELLEQLIGGLDRGELTPLQAAHGLIFLTAERGVLLPFSTAVKSTSADSDSRSVSTVSLNSVEDSLERSNDALWNSLAGKVTRHLITALSAEPPAGSKLDESFSEAAARRLRFQQGIEVLQLFNSAQRSWQVFKQIRMSHLERLIDRLFYTQQSGGHKRRTLSEVSANFPTFASAAVAMMREDFDLIRADYFPTIGNSQDSVINIYLDYVCQELADFAHTLERTLTESSAKQSGGARGGSGGTVHFFSNLANDALSLDTLLQITDLLATLAGLERDFVSVANDYWSASTHGLDQLQLSSLSSIGAEKPRGVLKRRQSNPAMLGGDRRMSIASEQGILVVSHDESSVVLETSSQLQPLLQWQAELEPYFPVLARSLEHQLHQSWQRTYSDRIRCSVDESVRQGRLDFPQLIHKSLQDYTQLVQRLMRLAVFCTDGGGSSGLLLKSLVATVQLHFHAMASAHSALLDGSGGGDGGGGGGGSPAPADGIPDAEFPIRIGDAAYAMHVCGHLAQSLAGCHAESSSAMYALHKTFSALLHRLTGEAELRYSQNFLTCLLFDAGSNYWEDGQEFHDETRVSFSVERWYLELRRIWHSLSSTCPHEISRCVLLSLLEKTLGFLLQRYAQATPSHRRVNQYRADITAILMMTEDLLYAVCEHAEQVTNPDQLEDASICFVHNCCSGLLACLAVVSSPLADLHRAFRKGLGAAGGKSSSSKSSDRQTAAGGESVSGSCTYWLSVVRPEMYLPDAVTLDAMPCQVALLMQLRLLQESPAARHEHVLAALLMKQFALSVQLVSRACLSASGSDSGCEATLACLLTVLSHCRGAQLEGPLRCLLPVLDRGGGGGGGGPDDEGQWEHLDRRRFLGLAKASDAPLWLRALGRLLEPHLETALRAAVSEAAQRKAAELQVPSRSVCPALHGPLPCGCAAPVPASRSSAAAAGSSAAAAADSLLVALAAEWPRTPPAVQFCLRALGDTAARRGARPIGDCAGLHILGACMAQHLRRLRLKDSASDLGLGADPDAVLQRLVEALTDEVRRPASVLRIVEAVSSQSASSMLAPFIDTVSPGPPSAPSGCSGGQSGVSAAWQDRRQLAAMLAEVDAAGHLPHLVGLGHLLRRNAECLAAGLGVAAADDDEVAAAAASAGFVCDLGPMEAAPFDPLRAAQRMGSDQRRRYFDADADGDAAEAADLRDDEDDEEEDGSPGDTTEEDSGGRRRRRRSSSNRGSRRKRSRQRQQRRRGRRPRFNWPELLADGGARLGLSLVNFRSLLGHRWEFTRPELLEGDAGAQSIVEALAAKFGL